MSRTRALRNTVISVLAISSAFIFCLAANLTILEKESSSQSERYIDIQIMVTDNNQWLNAVGTEIEYSKDTIEILSIDKRDSVISYWVEDPEFSNPDGLLHFAGVTFNGFTDKSVIILTLHCKTKGLGPVYFKYKEAQLLANDGLATNVNATLQNLSLDADQVSSKLASLHNK